MLSGTIYSDENIEFYKTNKISFLFLDQLFSLEEYFGDLKITSSDGEELFLSSGDAINLGFFTQKCLDKEEESMIITRLGHKRHLDIETNKITVFVNDIEYTLTINRYKISLTVENADNLSAKPYVSNVFLINAQ